MVQPEVTRRLADRIVYHAFALEVSNARNRDFGESAGGRNESDPVIVAYRDRSGCFPAVSPSEAGELGAEPINTTLNNSIARCLPGS